MTDKMRIALFIYDFPHKKTQDFFFRMSIYRFCPTVVIASKSVKLNMPKSILRGKYRHIDLLNPREMCELMGLNYIEIPHSHEDVPAILKDYDIDLGVIATARILKKRVIRNVKKGIVNFHPGLIPENRGLNAVKWAVVLDIPQGVTAHFIDEKVDRGRIIGKYIVPIFSYDSIVDINLRVYEMQLHILIPTLKMINDPFFKASLVDSNDGYHPPADEELDKKLLELFDAYKAKWSYDKNKWICQCGKKLNFFKKVHLTCDICNRKYKIFNDGSVEYLQVF